MNSIMVLRPYKYSGMWVFDDERVGLLREAFVAGADTMIDVATGMLGIENPEEGFTLVFSENKFPSAQIELEWIREEFDGNVYTWKEQNIEGWLCPALFKYFEKAPSKMYIEIKNKR